MRRLFAFLFRHDWQYDEDFEWNSQKPDVTCRFICTRCGELWDWDWGMQACGTCGRSQGYDRAFYHAKHYGRGCASNTN